MINRDILPLQKSERADSRKIEIEHLPALAHLLQARKSKDPYALSAGYYGLTGRRGLWIYSKGPEFLLYCRHPNIESKYIVFPPFAEFKAGFLSSFLRDTDIDKSEIILGRFDSLEAQFIKSSLNEQIEGLDINVIDEPVLDWLFPVHTLDTMMVSKHIGPQFRDFRQNINRAKEYRFCIDTASLQTTLGTIRQVAEKWARAHASDELSYTGFLSPYLGLLEMIEKSGLNLRGFVVKSDGEACGFALWEEASRQDVAISSLASLNVAHYRGISEFQYKEMCGILARRGYKQVCIGGSETHNLDRFKQKMQPVESLNLSSLQLKAA